MLPLPEILLKLDPATLGAIAAVVGPVPGLAPKPKPADTARALFLHAARFRAPIHVVNDISEMFDPQAAAAVFSILPRIASEAGCRAAVECARCWDDPRAAEWANWPALELAAALAMEVATTMDRAEKADAYERAKRYVTAARSAVDAEPPVRPTYELVAESPLALDPERLEKALRRALGEDLLSVWSAVDVADASLLLAAFVRRGPVAAPELTKSGRIVRRTYRPSTVDLLRISADGSRVALTLDEGRLLRPYAKALRLSLEPSFSLREIHPSTLDALMARVPAGMQVEITGLGFSFPDDAEYDIDGPNAWTDAKKEMWDRGTLRQVRLRAKDEHGRGFGIFLQAPHRVEIPELMTYPHARALLVALGLVKTGARATAPRSRVEPRAKKAARRAREARGRTLH